MQRFNIEAAFHKPNILAFIFQALDIRWSLAYWNNQEHTKTVFPLSHNYREANAYTHFSAGKKQKNAHTASSCSCRVYCKPTHPFDTIAL